jgi:hypothetical protein
MSWCWGNGTSAICWRITPPTMGCARTMHSTRIRRSIDLRRPSGVSHQFLGPVVFIGTTFGSHNRSAHPFERSKSAAYPPTPGRRGEQKRHLTSFTELSPEFCVLFTNFHDALIVRLGLLSAGRSAACPRAGSGRCHCGGMEISAGP